jgi:hypothetical protein
LKQKIDIVSGILLSAFTIACHSTSIPTHTVVASNKNNQSAVHVDATENSGPSHAAKKNDTPEILTTNTLPLAKAVEFDDEDYVSKFVVGNYIIQVHQLEDAEGFENSWFHVDYKGKRIFQSKRANGYTFETEYRDVQWVIPGQDITGDGKPNLVIGRHENGNICWKTVIIYELGPTLKKLQHFELCNSNLFYKDADNDGFPELEVLQPFVYSFDGAYIELYIEKLLKWNGSRFRFSFDLMKKPAPTTKELEETANDLRITEDMEWSDEHCHYDDPNENCKARAHLFSKMLELMISGNAHWAYKLFDMCWPDEFDDKETILQQFKEQTRQQKGFWRKVLKINTPIHQEN